MPVDVSLIQSIDLFADFAPEALDEFSNIMHPLAITEGEVLTRRGEPAHTFHVILSGTYLVYFKNKKSYLLENRGELIGVSTVLTPFRYVGTAVALTDGETLTIPGQELLRLIQGNASLGDQFMQRINQVVTERTLFLQQDGTAKES